MPLAQSGPGVVLRYVHKVVPVEVELAVALGVGEDVARVAVAHRVADIIPADGFHPVEMLFETDGLVEQVILPGPA